MAHRREPRNTRLLLVDDQTLLRQSLRRFLEGPLEEESGHPLHLEVTEAAGGRAALRLAEAVKPEVAIVEVAMHDLNGVDATRMLLKEHPKLLVIGLSMHGEPADVRGMLDAGARGFLLKTCRLEELVRAIVAVINGGLYLDARVASAVTQRASSGPDPTGAPPLPSTLTPKEREVLQLVAEGGSSKEIGVTLGITGSTVESHRAHLARKLGVSGVADLTKYAIRHGLTPLDR